MNLEGCIASLPARDGPGWRSSGHAMIINIILGARKNKSSFSPKDSLSKRFILSVLANSLA